MRTARPKLHGEDGQGAEDENLHLGPAHGAEVGFGEDLDQGPAALRDGPGRDVAVVAADGSAVPEGSGGGFGEGLGPIRVGGRHHDPRLVDQVAVAFLGDGAFPEDIHQGGHRRIRDHGADGFSEVPGVADQVGHRHRIRRQVPRRGNVVAGGAGGLHGPEPFRIPETVVGPEAF